MRTLDDLDKRRWPQPMPLSETPWWLRGLGFPRWRFRFVISVYQVHSRGAFLTEKATWVYVTKAQYARLFGRTN